MDFLPYFKSGTATRSVHHFKDFNVSEARFVKAVGSVINSSVFYLWFIVYGNGRNVALRDIQTFPADVDRLCSDSGPALAAIFDDLMADYKANSKTKTREDGVKLQEFDPSLSKPIMDRVDRVLAGYYRFTEEELDFILNYDIKYRLGRAAGGEEESE